LRERGIVGNLRYGFIVSLFGDGNCFIFSGNGKRKRRCVRHNLNFRRSRDLYRWHFINISALSF